MTEHKRLLDVRGLSCPEPAEQVLEAAAGLANGQFLEVIQIQEPRLLGKLLAKRGYCSAVRKENECLVTMKIWREQDNVARDAVETEL